jgi:hypothetical protein
MLNRVTSLLIGKDISRDAQVVAGAQIDTIMKSTGLAAGEIVVLDKNMTVLTAGATIADSDTIYIVQATSDTFDYSNIAGTAVTGNRRIVMSGPIVGSKVKSYKGKAYSAKSEQSTSFVLTGMHPVTAGTEYIIRIVYKDIKEHPGQFTQTYRHVATAADAAAIDTFGASMAAKINAHSGRRVNATYTNGTDTLALAAREIPESTATLSDIDDFSMVEFEAFFNYVDADGNWQTCAYTSSSTTAASKGSGEWEHVRDLEKSHIAQRGVTNQIWFPVVKPDMQTVKDETYDLLVIEHENPYQSPDNQYVKDAPHTTILALPDGASQTTDILAQLNPWMASCPGAFANVSF